MDTQTQPQPSRGPDYLQQSQQSRRTKQPRTKVVDLSPLVYGKLPPQALEFEQAVLGACLQFRTAVETVGEILPTPAAFYKESHGLIYAAIQELAVHRQPVDILTVVEQLTRWNKLEQVGGAYEVTRLTNCVVGDHHVVKHARIVAEKFMLREVIRVCSDKIAAAYEAGADAFDVIEEAERAILEVRQLTMRRDFRPLDRIMVESLQELEEQRDRDQHLTGVPSGFADLDYVTCGWQPTDLIILAARPSAGKTAFALALARNAVRLHPEHAVGLFSLEMKDKKLIHRLMASESGVWIWNLTNARLEDHQMKQLYTQGVQPLSKVNLLIDDTPSLPVSEFRAKARRMVVKHGVKIIFVDYLQLMRAPAHITNREQQIAHISQELKACAKELDVPVIALSQMSRDVEKAKWREPQLSDLRESGAIEQDADVVAFLWKPSEVDLATRPELLNVVYVGIKKHRNGALAKFLAIFKKEIQRWESLSVVDDSTLLPVGQKWTAATVAPVLRDITEAQRSSDSDADLPF